MLNSTLPLNKRGSSDFKDCFGAADEICVGGKWDLGVREEKDWDCDVGNVEMSASSDNISKAR